MIWSCWTTLSKGRSRKLISGMIMLRIFSTIGSTSLRVRSEMGSLLKTSGSFQLSSSSSSSLPLVTPRFNWPEFSERIWRMRTW